jgi:xanthine dehydrogenase accessory factor
MITGSLARRADQLRADRVPFATATVVRVSHPTSARPGDAALVLGDGTVEGFVGGVCAEGSVRLHGLRAMETGDALLLKLLPDADGDAEACCSSERDEEVVDGAVTAHNSCLSGGALEIFLEPCLPAPLLAVAGETPVAAALRELAPRLDFAVITVEAGDLSRIDGSDAALVVATHGRDEEHALAKALVVGVPYVGLVASDRRGAAVRAALDVPDVLRASLRTPAGLDIGARTAPEIALSILAEIVQERRNGPAVRTVPEREALPAIARPGEHGDCCGGHAGG